MTEATQEGAQEVLETPENNPRNAQLAELQKKRGEMALQETEEGERLYGDPQPEAPQEPQPEVKKRKLKVDGEELEVEEDKIIEAGVRALQKESAADKRLEEATRLLREAQARAAQSQAPAAAQQQQPSEDPDVVLAEALQYGDREKAAWAVKQLREGGKIQPDQQQAVIQNVLQMLDYRDAVSWYQQEYPEISKDPMCNVLMREGIVRARAAGDQRPLKEMMKGFADELRQWRGVSMDDRKERKSTISEVQSAGGKKPAPQPEKPKSREELIAEMQNARSAKQAGIR